MSGMVQNSSYMYYIVREGRTYLHIEASGLLRTICACARSVLPESRVVIRWSFRRGVRIVLAMWVVDGSCYCKAVGKAVCGC